MAAVAAGSGVTLGVEEEFLLVDPVTGATVPRAARVLARAGRHPLSSGTRFHPELASTQVEAATGVCTTLRSLRHQLREGRGRLAAAAGWRPGIGFAAVLVFGAIDAAAPHLQQGLGVGAPMMAMVPYVLAIVALAATRRRLRWPAALSASAGSGPGF